jgi:hypothetical protein
LKAKSPYANPHILPPGLKSVVVCSWAFTLILQKVITHTDAIAIRLNKEFIIRYFAQRNTFLGSNAIVGGFSRSTYTHSFNFSLLFQTTVYFYSMKRLYISIILSAFMVSAQAQDSVKLRHISDDIMLYGTCYENLRTLCKQVGHRLSGSPAAAKAVQWGVKAMKEAGADSVWLQAMDVPHWVRGKETLSLSIGEKGAYKEVHVLSLGNSNGTNGKVLEKKIVMVKNFDEFKALKDEQIKGNIIFFNYRFRQELISTGEGYGDAGKYRWSGANVASARGAAGIIIRAISTGVDDMPHTGAMGYADTVKKIPAVAIGNKTADILEAKCRRGVVKARLQSHCHMLKETVRSYNVVGEIRGSKYPDQIIVVGGHLDSWDVGEGAHDDGTGCVQSIEVLRVFKALGIHPKRSIRAVLFMNEENGLKGGQAYADSAKARNEHHILAIETDGGGFSPRGVGLVMDDEKKAKIRSWAHYFRPYGVYDFSHSDGGADISVLHKAGVPMAGLMPDQQRYFDVHHTNNDVFEAVNHRELKLGAVTLAQLIYLVSKYGLE